ncbi:MAG: tripeptidyl-peptidase Serine peptidase family [Marmoricola sp.]|jgi:pimeloyl-ACP methyl ester carboxylesterase|nr:tripeptidyl-peptidase Serine peptidase family [Marmoricola sp.]
MTQTSPPPSTRSAVLIGVLVGVLIFVLGGAGFATWKYASDNKSTNDAAGQPATSDSAAPSSVSPTTATGPMPATDPKLAAFYDQKLDWKKCSQNECTTLTVPLDYAKPDGRTITLAVLKVPAADPSKRIGSLIVNPGGPGGSGTQFAAYGALEFEQTLADDFDIVGFDPRGVGHSTPLECASTAEKDALIAADPDPDTKAERDHSDALIRQFGEGCLRESGDLTRHMSTVEAAKDMDILRAAVGDPKIYYFGASYGTFLGATYANLFPTHVGRMVLDGAIDPALSNEQLSLAQAHGFEVALRSYVQDCIDQGGCFLGDTVDAGTKKIRAFLDAVEANPLPTDSDRELTEGYAMVGIWLPLYNKLAWPQLTAALQQAMNEHKGTALLALSDQYASRGPNGYTDNSLEALNAVNCLDHDDTIPTSQVPSHFAEFLKASPTFGKAFAFSLSFCSDWPVKSGQRTHALHAKGAPPIVVIGTTRDPATPLAWAQALAKELDSGVLVTRNGDGHTGFNQGNSCVDDAVNTYLSTGTPPKNGLAC